MYQLLIDQYHNRVMITLRAPIVIDDFYRVDEHLRRVIPKFQPGFTIINNITLFEPIDHFPAQVFRETIEYLKEQQIGRVIRVVGNSREALRFFHSQTLPVENYAVNYVPTVSDALKLVP